MLEPPKELKKIVARVELHILHQVADPMCMSVYLIITPEVSNVQ